MVLGRRAGRGWRRSGIRGVVGDDALVELLPNGELVVYRWSKVRTVDVSKVHAHDRRGEYRDIQAAIFGQLGGNISFRGDDFAISRNQQHIVKRDALADDLVRASIHITLLP